jgi:hypothetical protein
LKHPVYEQAAHDRRVWLAVICEVPFIELHGTQG